MNIIDNLTLVKGVSPLWWKLKEDLSDFLEHNLFIDKEFQLDTAISIIKEFISDYNSGKDLKLGITKIEIDGHKLIIQNLFKTTFIMKNV
jgi:hypothetical protein